MFERFTPRARRVLVVAQDEARTLRHNLIRPEHLLIGLSEGDGIAAQALRGLGVTTEVLRQRAAAALGAAVVDKFPDRVPFSPRAKKVLERSLREALALGHNYIGTEHLVLGLLRVGEEPKDDSSIADIIGFFGVDFDGLRQRVLALCARPGVGGATEASPLDLDAIPGSPALTAALRRALDRGGENLTTGELLQAILADEHSQVSRALSALGIGAEAVGEQLAKVPLGETSDARPGPRTVEVVLGEVSTSIDDPELAARLVTLSSEELRAALRRAVAEHRGDAVEPPGGKGTAAGKRSGSASS